MESSSPLADLPPELLLEIFDLLTSPSSLLRCAVVCKAWHRLILSLTSFHRRFFPPFPVGFFHFSDTYYKFDFKFVAAISFPALKDFDLSFILTGEDDPSASFSLVGCRNGRVVLVNAIDLFEEEWIYLIVCNPLSQEWFSLPPIAGEFGIFYTSLVLLTDVDDDRPPSSAFRLVVVVSERVKLPDGHWIDESSIRSFSSVENSWSPAIQFEVPYQNRKTIGPPVVINGIIHWLQKGDVVLAVRVATWEVYWIKLPSKIYHHLSGNILLAATEQKSLCFLALDGFFLSIWNHHRRDGDNAEKIDEWLLEEEIDLQKLLQPRVVEAIKEHKPRKRNWFRLRCFAESSGTVLLESRTVVYLFHLRTRRMEKFSEKGADEEGWTLQRVYPYEIGMASFADGRCLTKGF